MIEIGALVKWDGVFTQAYDSQYNWIGIAKDFSVNPFGQTYWRVLFADTEQWCWEKELEIIA